MGVSIKKQKRKKEVMLNGELEWKSCVTYSREAFILDGLIVSVERTPVAMRMLSATVLT